MRRSVAAAMLASAAAPAAAANQAVTYPFFQGSFDDAAFAVESASVGRDLVIDYVSHTGEMRNRTGADVGSSKDLFNEADIILFCSAQVSRSVMEADSMNIAHRPYGIFMADQGDDVVNGDRFYPDGPMQEVQALLDEIMQEALE